MIRDGLWEIYNDYHMGATGENVAEKYGITREQQDEYAVDSHRKAAAAQEGAPLLIADGPRRDSREEERRSAYQVWKDESPREDTSIESLRKLKPAFKKDGTGDRGQCSRA